MKWYSNLSIKHKVPLIIVFVSILVFSIVCLLVTIPIHSWALKDSSTIARLSAMEAGARLSETISGTVNIIRNSSEVVAELSASKIIRNDSKRQFLLDELLGASMAKNNELHNMWCTLEPNALDGMDSYFINRVGSNSQGIFAPWILKDTIIVSENDEMQDYYRLPKELESEVITDIYWDNVNGDSIQMFSVCIPIMHNNKFLGVMGTDIYIKDMIEIISDISSIGLGKLVTNKGVVMVHYENKHIGGLAEYGDPEILSLLSEGKIIERIYKYEGKPIYTVYVPIQLIEGFEPWYFSVNIPVKDIYARSREVVKYLMLCCFIGILLVAFFVWLMMNPMVKDIIGVTRIISRMTLGNVNQIDDMSEHNSNRDEIENTKNEIRRLISENTELKNKQRDMLNESNELSQEIESYKGIVEKFKSGYKGADEHIYQQKRFDIVTIMFVEIKGLSNAASVDNTSKYMDKFDEFILCFEKIVEKYKLVKLNSIGDNFVCAGGIPEKNVINPITVILAAFEMLCAVEDEMPEDNGGSLSWSLNISIHTGPVTALVGGHNHKNYLELKGDTMNEASRIVSVGKMNSVLISANTYELVKELFDCNFTSVLPVKYRNKLDIFTVNGLKPVFASNKNRFFPNSAFRTQLMLVQFADLQEFILNKLENELPENLYYHNVKHTVDVVTQSELIGWAEGVSDHQLLLLKTAALFHDTGHTISYANHEERSVYIAQEILPRYDYMSSEIDEICRIIMATKLPPRPADLLESIICDADLDYLGRIDFIPVSNTLYEELKVQNDTLTLNNWNKMQLKFISSHQYFTKTGRSLRNVKKQEQIDRIKKLIE